MKIHRNINFSIPDNHLTTTVGTTTATTYTEQVTSSTVEPTGAEKIRLQDEVR